MTWPSWANVTLGIWLILSPWALGYLAGTAISEDIVLGVALIVFGFALAMSAPGKTAAAWVNVLLGIWIVLAPWIFGYVRLGGPAVANDQIVGILAIIFALLRIAESGVRVGGPPQT
jgi:hypothetical protein